MTITTLAAVFPGAQGSRNMRNVGAKIEPHGPELFEKRRVGLFVLGEETCPGGILLDFGLYVEVRFFRVLEHLFFVEALFFLQFRVF